MRKTTRPQNISKNVREKNYFFSHIYEALRNTKKAKLNAKWRLYLPLRHSVVGYVVWHLVKAALNKIATTEQWQGLGAEG